MQPETQKDAGPSTVEEILNKKGFAEFLAQSSSIESADDSSEQEILQQYEVFVARNEAKKEFKRMCEEQVKFQFGLKP